MRSRAGSSGGVGGGRPLVLLLAVVSVAAFMAPLGETGSAEAPPTDRLTLAGLNAPGATSTSENLTLYVPWAGAELDAFLPVLSAFENGTGIPVDAVTVRYEEHWTVLQPEFEQNRTPADVAFAHPDFVAWAARENHSAHAMGIVYPGEYRPGTLDRGKLGESVYGAPAAGMAKPGFWYRKSFFDSQGLQAPTTWQEFNDLLDALEAIQSVEHAIVSGDGVGWPLSDVTEHFIATYGGADLHRRLTTGEVAWTSSEVRTLFQDRLVPLLADGHFSEPLDWSSTALDGWWNGGYGLYFMGSWIADMVEAPDDLGVFPLPPAAGTVAGSVMSPDVLFVPLYTERFEAAMELARFIVGAEGQGIRVEQGGRSATHLDVGLDAYPPEDREAAVALEGREVLPDLDDTIGGEFQTTFWSELQSLWVSEDPAADLEPFLITMQDYAPSPPSNQLPAAEFTVSPTSGGLGTLFAVNASTSSDAEDPPSALEARWDWENDGRWDTAWSTTKTADHRYSEGGTYDLRLEVRDTSDGRNTTAHTVVVVADDGEPPVTASTIEGQEGSGGWFTSAVTVTLEASDDVSGVSLTQYAVDGGPWQPYTEPFAIDSEGRHTLAFFSTDWAENVETPRTAAVNIDRTPPSIEIRAPGAGQVVTSSSVRLSWSAGDAVSGVQRVTVRMDGADPADGGAEGNLTLWDVPDGGHAVTVTVSDEAGFETTASVEFLVDTNLLSPRGPVGPWLLVGIGAGTALAGAVLWTRWKGRRG